VIKNAKIYNELANKLLWSLLTFLSLLAYATEARPFFHLTFGTYFVGLFDGTIATILTLIAIFYLKARNSK
jgi:hypothetical protein